MWILIFFPLNANDFLAESQFWGHLPLLSELHRLPPGLIISLTSPFLCSNYKGEKDGCKAIRAAIIFVKTFPTVLFPSISYHLFSFFSCNPMCAFLCTLFLHFSAVLFLISHPCSPKFPMLFCILGKISQKLYVL